MKLPQIVIPYIIIARVHLYIINSQRKMFSREYMDDSYTLDNYIHFMQKTNTSEQKEDDEMEIEQNQIQKMEYFAQRKRKMSTQLSIFSWLVKDKPQQKSLFVSLDKQLIIKIYSYLRISETFIISSACSYLFSCYKHLWINRNFFEKFQTDKFTSEQLSNVIQNSKLDHIRQLKQIYMGKNIKKNREKIKMRITDGSSSSNSMLEVFSISPKLKNGTVFIMDSHLENILNSSYKGLKCIELHRCPYIKKIASISRCLELQKLAISYNEFVTTENLAPIIKRCLKLQKLQISQCKSLDENIFKHLKHAEQLTSLTLRHFKQSFGNFSLLSQCQKLQCLNIDDSLITDDEFMNVIREVRSIKYLSIQGCALLTNVSLDFLLSRVEKKPSELRQVLINRINNLDNDKIQQLQQKLYKINLERQPV